MTYLITRQSRCPFPPIWRFSHLTTASRGQAFTIYQIDTRRTHPETCSDISFLCLKQGVLLLLDLYLVYHYMIQVKVSNSIFSSGICLKAQLLSERLMAKYTWEKRPLYPVNAKQCNVWITKSALEFDLCTYQGFWVKSRLLESVCTLVDFTCLAGEETEASVNL